MALYRNSWPTTALVIGLLVKTGGRYAGARGGGDRSWLLIKHKDDWAGDVDIASFAPKSVKSDGDFEDILAQDNPDIWHTNRPAKGGDTGAMFSKIIEKAARLKASRSSTEGKGPRSSMEEKASRSTPKAADKPAASKKKKIAPRRKK